MTWARQQRHKARRYPTRTPAAPPARPVCPGCGGSGKQSRYDQGWRSLAHSDELAAKIHRCLRCMGSGEASEVYAGGEGPLESLGRLRDRAPKRDLGTL